jgi:hypothetical protein
MPAEQDRIATLRQAAAAKREAAAARAEAGIRKLAKTGQPVTFRAVAAAGGVSVDFLYRHPELRARIARWSRTWCRRRYWRSGVARRDAATSGGATWAAGGGG